MYINTPLQYFVPLLTPTNQLYHTYLNLFLSVLLQVILSEEKFFWAVPNLSSVSLFCRSKLGWSEDEVDTILFITHRMNDATIIDHFVIICLLAYFVDILHASIDNCTAAHHLFIDGSQSGSSHFKVNSETFDSGSSMIN